MANILAVGIATLDIINSVSNYPNEDDEIRVVSQQRSRGGNATNTLTVLSQLNHQCHWAGVLVDEPDTAFIEAELTQYQINTNAVLRLKQGKIPTSYITHNQTTGSRTIVHYRDLPEYDFASFQKIALDQFDWIHFEGRNTEETCKMLHWAKQYSHCPISIEIEKERTNIEQLFPYANVLMISRPFAQGRAYQNAEQCLHALQAKAPQALISCTWGSSGAWLMTTEQQIFHSPAFPPKKLIDTLATGDTFNAGLIDQLIKQIPSQQALSAACQLAGKKCGFMGLNFRPLA